MVLKKVEMEIVYKHWGGVTCSEDVVKNVVHSGHSPIFLAQKCGLILDTGGGAKGKVLVIFYW